MGRPPERGQKGGTVMIVARIIFHKKTATSPETGWVSGKYTFLKANDPAKFDEWAKKNARGREYLVQIANEDSAKHWAAYAYDLEGRV